MVLPLSYSFNLDGIALFLAVAAVFIAQACNIHLSLGRVMEMLLMMLLTSKGAGRRRGQRFCRTHRYSQRHARYPGSRCRLDCGRRSLYVGHARRYQYSQQCCVYYRDR